MKYLVVIAFFALSSASGQWSVRQPIAPEFNPASVTFCGTEGIALSASAVFFTHDGGDSWTLVRSNQTNESFTTARPLGSGRMIIAGMSQAATLYYSPDRASSWEWPVPGYPYHWKSVHAFGDTVLIFGDAMQPYGGMMMRSVDNGATWTRTETSITDVSFLNGTRGWRTDGGRISRTTDGGASWSTQYDPGSTPAISTVHFTDARHGWAGGSMGLLLRTTDGGQSWAQIFNTGSFASLTCFAFPSKDTGYAAGNGAILKTTDSGTTWASLPMPSVHWTWTARSLAFTSVNDGFMCTDDSTFRTTDGGNSWTLLGSPGAACIAFVGNGVGYASGQDDRILKTVNGGSTWVEKATVNSDYASLVSIAFASPERGWIVGRYGSVYRTVDAGTSWQLMQSQRLPRFNATAAVDAQHIWFAGAKGLILKYNAATGAFTHQPTGLQINLTRLECVDTLHGWAMAEGSAEVLRTTNGGVEWQSVKCTGSSSRVSFHFVDRTHGWLMTTSTYGKPIYASYSDIHRTTDGGVTWQQSAHLNGIFHRVFFVSPQEGIIAGPNGSIMRSLDGGMTWLGEPSGTTVSLNDIGLSTHLVVVGDSGVVLRSEASYATPPGQDGPKNYLLEQNFPNPFNPSTTVRYGLPQRSHVTLAVFNILGQQVAVLHDGEQDAGYHEVRFDAQSLPGGVYFYRLVTGSFTETKKLLLVR